MRKLAQIISWLALVGVIVPSLLYLGGRMTLPAVKLWMLVFTMVWFVTVPIWMERKPEE
jgi:hypothetical protein